MMIKMVNQRRRKKREENFARAGDHQKAQFKKLNFFLK